MIPLGHLEKGKTRLEGVLSYLRPQGILTEEINPTEDEFIIKSDTQGNNFLPQIRVSRYYKQEDYSSKNWHSRMAV